MGSTPEVVSIYVIENIFKLVGRKCIAGANAYYLFLKFGKRKLKKTIMNTTENNKIIAEFMGNRNYLYNNDKSAMYFILTNTAGEELIVNYNNDWGLLMEVVEKIEETEVDNNILMLESIGNMAKFIFDDGCRFLNDCIGETKIEAVYNACIAFIEWYNKNAVKR